jgi:glyoxylase-like metal-dependent hydrolase (beta-lactamase superfamily II)
MRFLLVFALMVLAPIAHAADEGDVKLVPLMDGVWMHVSYGDFNGHRVSANGLVVKEGDTLFIVDSAWGDANTEILLDMIEREIGLPVYAAVATHFHEDRAAGAEAFRARGIPFYASVKTRELVEKAGRVPPAEVITVGPRPGGMSPLGPLTVMYPGAAHTTDNLVVWLAEQKLLFGGCAVRAASNKNLGYYADGDPAHWDDAMERVMANFDGIETVVPGHGAVGGPELLTHTRDLALAHTAKAK